jgi:endonuclease YncB( thermonuclease family)
VISVHDGDTISVIAAGKLMKVRLFGVDAPKEGQPFGKEARAALVSLVRNQLVEIEFVDTDEHGPKVARVRAGGQDVSLSLVQSGFAWWYRQYAPGDKSLATAEDAARLARRGLWAGDHPVPPWDWRHDKP